MIPGRMPADAHEWTVLIIGFVVSFIVALGGGMVHELGPPARLHPVRHLPDHSRHRGAGVGDERVKVSILAITRFRQFWKFRPPLH